MLELFNILDWVMLLVVAIFVARSFIKGFFHELGSLIGLLLAIVGGFTMYQPVAGFLRRVVGMSNFWWEAVSFMLCFLVICLVVMFIAGRIAKVLHSASLSFINRMLGAGVGLIKGALICYLIVTVLLMMRPFSDFLETHNESFKNNWVSNSYLAPSVVTCGKFMLSFIPDDFVKDLQAQAGLLKDQTVELTPGGPAGGGSQ